MSEYCMKHKLLKEKIREKRIQNESYMQSINESYKKNKNEFWKFVYSKQSDGSKKKIQLLRDDTYNCSVSDTKDKLHVLKEHYQKLGTSNTIN